MTEIKINFGFVAEDRDEHELAWRTPDEVDYGRGDGDEVRCDGEGAVGSGGGGDDK